MKNLVAAGAIILSAALTPAMAADMPVKAKPVVPPSNWTGFYLSGGGGYGLSSIDQQTLVPSTLVTHSGGHGYFGTVGGGYDWQFAPTWVAGVFADAQFGGIKAVIQNYDLSFGGFDTGVMKNNASFAVGARLGYLIAPNALSYVNAGYSHAEFTGGNTYAGALVGNPAYYVTTIPRLHRHGWFVGGGVEHSLDLLGISAPGWFLKTEYRLAEYGRKTIDIPIFGQISPTSFKPYVQTASTSLVYRFNSGAASTAAPLVVKAPASAPVNWTGFYLSGGGGYGLWDSDVQKVDSNGIFYGANGYSMHQYTGGRGYFGTVGGGYDWQFAPKWVAGLFADAQFGDLKGSIIDVFQNYPGTTKNNLSYAAGARLGYLVAPSVLSYVNGGYSHADFTQASLTDSTGTPLSFPYTVVKQHHDGWFIGAGVENALNGFGVAAPGWFMKTEYRLASYARQNITLLGPTGAPTGDTVTFKPTVQTVSTSLVYRFK